jgi:Co/Zn/Cd efflux system component
VGFLAATVVVMFLLARAKRRTGLSLGNRPLVANGSMTFIDGCLATGVLVALAAQMAMGWWWADPLAAGIVAVVALNEARHGWVEAPSIPGSRTSSAVATARGPGEKIHDTDNPGEPSARTSERGRRDRREDIP